MPGALPGCCRLSRLEVRGFKSLREVGVRLRGIPVVVLGPNGSGKTGLLESIVLLRDFLDYLKGRSTNPFLRWWGFENIVWRHETNTPISVKVELDCSGCPGGFLGRNRVSYSLTVTGAGGTVRVLKEEACVEDYGCMVHEGSKINISLSPGMLIEELGDTIRRSLDILIPSAASSTGETSGQCIDTSDRETVNRIIAGVTKAYSSLSMEAAMMTRSILDIYVYQSLNREYGLDPSIFTNAYRPVVEKEVWKASYDKASMLSRVIAENSKCKDLGAAVFEAAGMMLVNNLSSHIVDLVFNLIVRPSMLLGEYIEKITYIGMIDYKAVKTPEPSFSPADRLQENAGNLKKMLFHLGQGRLPETAVRLLREVLGAGNVAGYFELTGDGRITLKLVVDGLEIPPPLIPDGAWKAMAIAAAVLSGATIVIVDGFEDGLYLGSQKAIVEVLREHGATSMLAAHSAGVLAFIEDPASILVLWKEKGETRAASYNSREDLIAKLEELGLMVRMREEEQEEEKEGEAEEEARTEEKRRRRFRFFR